MKAEIIKTTPSCPVQAGVRRGIDIPYLSFTRIFCTGERYTIEDRPGSNYLIDGLTIGIPDYVYLVPKECCKVYG